VTVFKDVAFVIQPHAIERWCSDRLGEERSPVGAKEEIVKTVRDGVVLMDLGTHRYIKNGNLVFPCKKSDKPHIFAVLTVLTWDMFANGSWQYMVEKYGA
jgi:hypothetical protein